MSAEDTEGLDIFDPDTVELIERFKDDQLKLAGNALVEYLQRRQRAYRAVFGNLDSEDVRIVLHDLAVFARAHSTAFNSDPRIHALLEGRREVYYRIKDHTQLSDDLMYEKYVAADIQRKT